LRSAAQLIEEVLRARGLDTSKARLSSAEGPAWSLRQGSAEVLVFLTPHQSGSATLQVVAPVLRASAEALAQGALCRRLLELNATSLQQAAFGLRGDQVVLTSDRSTEGLDAVEVEEMLVRVADYADHWDDVLVAEYGGRRGSDA
jgi:hypothetical protein